MIRVIAAVVLSVLAASVHSQTTLPNIFTKDPQIKAKPLQADLDVLVAAINTLTGQFNTLNTTVTGHTANLTTLNGGLAAVSGRVSKLEGNIQAADLVGTYVVNGFQTELGVGLVSNYTYSGTATLALNGDFVFSAAEKGTGVHLPGTTYLVNLLPPADPFTTTWALSGGAVNVPDFPSLSVVAGGRLLVGVSANSSDGTQVLMLLTRTN